MTTVTQAPRTADYLIAEAGDISREVVTVKSGEVLKAGTVVGKITVGGKYVAHDPAGADGSEVAAGITYDAVDATGGDQVAVIHARLAEVDANLLQWGAGVLNQGHKDAAIADLAVHYIIAR